MSSASPDSRGRPCRRPRTSRTGCVRDSYVSPTSSPTVRLSRRTSIRRTSSRSPSRNRGSPSSRVSPIRSDRKSTRLNSSHRTTSCPAYPYTTLFRSVLRVTRFQGKAVPEAEDLSHWMRAGFLRFSDFLAHGPIVSQDFDPQDLVAFALTKQGVALESRFADPIRSEEHTSELQSPYDVVPCLPLHDALPICPPRHPIPGEGRAGGRGPLALDACGIPTFLRLPRPRSDCLAGLRSAGPRRVRPHETGGRPRVAFRRSDQIGRAHV